LTHHLRKTRNCAAKGRRAASEAAPAMLLVLETEVAVQIGTAFPD
jgi:hypothetical protein